MTMLTRRRLAALGSAAAAAALAARTGEADAQPAWPSRPVTLLVPFPAGGSADVLARLLAQHFAEAFGQPFVVENRVGANGNIGTQVATRAAPDGQTLLLTTNGPISTNTLLFRSMPYNPFTDLTPIVLLADLPIIIVARRDAPYASLRQMIAYAQERPGRINCGVPSTGALGHLASELLQRRAGISYAQVPFRGSGPLTNGLLSGAVEVAFDLVASNLPHIQAGTLRVLGVAAQEALPSVAGAEPIAAQGFPGFEAIGWTAILGPAGLPGPIVRRLNEAANQFLAKAETRAMILAMGSRAMGGAPADLARKMQAEVAHWRPVIQAAGISLD
jgi:tripartite-type tricarboxylate transporter receptor subunit TctC